MAASKAYTITNTWQLVASNATEIFIYANKSYNLDLYIGTTAPSESTADFVPVEAISNFSASSLVSASDKVYIRCASSVPVVVKVLTA